MSRTDVALAWMNARKGRVVYSMEQRWGPSSYDCSSAIYYALIAAGYFPQGTAIGSTESLFNDLERFGWTKLAPNADGSYSPRRGDVFIWGVRGASWGANGHTGIFLDDNENIIHCNYGNNGISVQQHDSYWSLAGRPAATFYRPPRDTVPAPQVRAQNQNQSGWVAKRGTFTVNDTLPVSNDTNPNSPAQGEYKPGQSFIYDGYVAENGFVWLTYTSYSGKRRYVAIGPDDNNPSNTWGTGFFN